MVATRVIRRLRDLQDVDTVSDPGLGSSPVDDGSGVYPLTLVTTQQDLDGVLASVAAVDWVELELQNGFVNYPGQPELDGVYWAPARYRLAANNVVHMEGLLYRDEPLTDNDAGLVIAQLPPDARPGLALWYDCPTHVQFLARVDVYADGTILFKGLFGGDGDAQYVSLSGITFSVGAAQ